MYAVIETGGKQYRVEEGTVLQHDRRDGFTEGDKIEFDRVLLVVADGDVQIGTPYVEGVTVKGEVQGEEKGDKIIVYKYKSKKGYRRKRGHRQSYMTTRIIAIES